MFLQKRIDGKRRGGGPCVFRARKMARGALYNSRVIKWKPGIAVFHVDKSRLRNESGGKTQKDAPRPRGASRTIDAHTRTTNDTKARGGGGGVEHDVWKIDFFELYRGKTMKSEVMLSSPSGNISVECVTFLWNFSTTYSMFH